MLDNDSSMIFAKPMTSHVNLHEGWHWKKHWGWAWTNSGWRASWGSVKPLDGVLQCSAAVNNHSGILRPSCHLFPPFRNGFWVWGKKWVLSLLFSRKRVWQVDWCRSRWPFGVISIGVCHLTPTDCFDRKGKENKRKHAKSQQFPPLM